MLWTVSIEALLCWTPLSEPHFRGGSAHKPASPREKRRHQEGVVGRVGSTCDAPALGAKPKDRSFARTATDSNDY